MTYVWETYNPALRLLTFEDAMGVVDWNVIALILEFLNKTAALEINATLVLLGRPEDGASAFQLSSLQAFANEIKEDTGFEVQIV